MSCKKLASLKDLPLNVPSLNILYAASNTGKTYFLKELLYWCMKKNLFDRVYVFSPTGNLSTSGWNEVITGKYIQYSFDIEKLDKLLELNKKVIEGGEDRRICVVLDDILPTDMGHQVWTKISTKLRHYGASIFFTCQYYYKLPTALRNNGHNIFIFRQSSEKNLKGLYEEVLCSNFSTKKDCYNFIKNNTKGYNVLVVDIVNSTIYSCAARDKPYTYKIKQ